MAKSKKGVVKLREKPLKNGSKSFYLDVWHNGKRKYEFLKLYLVKPTNSKDRENNKKNKDLAESIRAKRQLELKSNEFGISTEFKLETNFIEYFRDLTEKRKESQGNYGNWDSALKHIIKCFGDDITFTNVNTEFVEQFKSYLQKEAKAKSLKPLSQNTQTSYFNKLKAAINQAFEERILSENPSKRVKGIKPEETVREYLTLEELKKIVKVECRYEVLKRAFLFSCLTGIRWSDIQKMTWSEVKKHNEGYRIIFRQKKTKGQEYLDISNQARQYLKERGKPEERVFVGLKYSAWHNMELQKWIMKAGIIKDITFHCSRHTFAVIQLELGTDIYTLSKLLGHSELKTTQIYAKILDQKKRDAVNKIPDINI